MLLPGIDVDLTGTIAERLRQQVEAELKSALKADSDRIITSSFGFVSSRSGAKDLQALVEQADQALYSSKHNGRNRVTCWDEIERQRVA